MTHNRSIAFRWLLPVLAGMCLLIAISATQSVSAINRIPDPDPKPGSYGLEARKKQAPPTTGAAITTPGNGAAFGESPITVNGICPNGLLVQLYNNGVMVGSVMCQSGSFSLQVSLFAGTNELTALVYDDLDQVGPSSNVVTIQYTDTRFTAFGQLITLTSSYGRRSAGAGSSLTWPLQLTGGAGPYAFSIDWGDGSKAELKSQLMAGLVDISHVYKRAGIYQINIRVTDANGVSAFLQVIAVSNGEVTGDTAGAGAKVEDGKTKVIIKIIWIPAALALLMLFPAYWLGRRSQLISIRNRMLKERDGYAEKHS